MNTYDFDWKYFVTRNSSPSVTTCEASRREARFARFLYFFIFITKLRLDP